MQKINWFLFLLVTLGAYGFSLFNQTQLSEKQFFNDFLTNTTHIDIYNQKTASLFLNNKTHVTHFIQLKNATDFEDQLAYHNYTYEILYKESHTKKIFDILWLLFFVFMIIQSRGIFGFSRSIFSEDDVKTKLKDVAGLDHQKQEVFEFVDFLKNREKYLEVGARMPRGALFHGPPGCGKTLLAKAVAGECGVSFLSVAGPDFSEMFVGVGASRVRDLFQKARKKAPCIVFIDEIDALARSRHNSPSLGHQEKENTLNRFLIELDGFEDNDKVLVFAATNRVDMLDKALLRPGRFDRKIQFELPERGDREKIFTHYLNKLQLDDDVEKIASILSKQSFGFSCADIANICNEASILSVRQSKEKVTRDILEMAIDNVLLGHEKKTFRLSDAERRIVAYHESGHSVASYLLPNVKPPIKVSIMPRGKSALGFSQSEVDENKLRSQDELKERICVLLGGRIAEELFCGGITTGASDDIEKCTKVAYQYIAVFGMDDQIGCLYCNWRDKTISEDLRQKVDQAVQTLIRECYQRTTILLQEKKEIIKKMAESLLEKETLNQEDIASFFN